MTRDDIIDLAGAIVGKPPTRFGYSDIGDVLVRWLRDEITHEEAVEKMSLLDEDYDRERRKPNLDDLPTIVFVGDSVNMPRVRDVLGLRQFSPGWSRHVKLVKSNHDLLQLHGMRGPDVWWVNWGATREQKIFCQVREFKSATVKECSDVVATYLGAIS